MLSVWGEKITLLRSVSDCSLKNSICWFVRLFDIFVGFFFSCCDFCFGSACRGRGRGEKLSGGTRKFFVVVFCFSCFIFDLLLFLTVMLVLLLYFGQSALCLWVQCCELSYVCLWQSHFDTVAVQDVKSVFTRKSRIFSFYEGVSLLYVFMPQSMGVVLGVKVGGPNTL